MKYLPILLMFLYNACYGQTTGVFLSDSLLKIMRDSNWATLSAGNPYGVPALQFVGNGRTSGTIIYENEPPVYHRKKDTVNVLLLICDTSNKSSTPNEVAWKYGYSVRELHNVSEDNNLPYMPMGGMFNEYNYWRHLYYLDINKIPLSKNIVVWDSKETP